MSLTIGLDTGGTYTDAVLYNRTNSKILSSAKAPTTHNRLSDGVIEAMKRLLAEKPDLDPLTIDMVCLSTTLATNAVTEGMGGSVGLILIGYDDSLEVVKELKKLPKTKIRFLKGGHDYYGMEEEPLDEQALLKVVDELSLEVDALAVSAFFSVTNPSHELFAKQLIANKTELPVTLGHQLTGKLGSIRRAATAALNAGLTPLIYSLVKAVKKSMEEFNLSQARLMMVKGDGSLVSEGWARNRPIETVVSGPAASAVGARVLISEVLAEKIPEKLWVMDVGGTTSDLAYLNQGYPKINSEGAYVSGWWTMVEAAETRTRGLGGDSLVEISIEKNIKLGPRRVYPLCRLGQEHPDIIRIMERQRYMGNAFRDLVARFFIKGRFTSTTNSEIYNDIKDSIEDKPFSFEAYSQFCMSKRERFFYGLVQVDDPALMVSAFTPTDALSVLGKIDFGNSKAAKIGAAILGSTLNLNAEEFSEHVLKEFGRQMAEEFLAQAMINEKIGDPEIGTPSIVQSLISKALGREVDGKQYFKIKLNLDSPVVVMGAPAAVFAPYLETVIEGQVIVPPCYEVAGAVGAAASHILLNRTISIMRLENLVTYRVFLPQGFIEYHSLEGAIMGAKKEMEKHMAKLAKLAGAKNPIIACDAIEHKLARGAALLWGKVMELNFTAEDRI